MRSSRRAHSSPGQLSLPGFDVAPPPATDGLFFAIFPDTRTAARIEQFARHLCSKYQWAPAPLALQRYHVTLHHLGNYSGGLPQAVVIKAIRAAATVTTRPFAVAFDRAEDFRGNPLVLRADEGVLALREFRDALGKALDGAGLAGHAQSAFVPHVTLAYHDGDGERRRVVERLDEVIAWSVHEFVLVHSLLGQTRHVALARWPLRS
jgi:2'-5' RNA ligase